MKRIVWLTDIHLNFLLARQLDDFLKSLAEQNAGAVLISGDIAEAHNVVEMLTRLDDALGTEIYFVLGNHDFYHGSIAEVRTRVSQLCAGRPRLHYLTQCGVEALTPALGLVGHDGWADGRLGDYPRSLVMMHDFRLIAELAGRSKQERWEVVKRLGDEAASHIRRVLPAALSRYAEVMLVTHVPPFQGACWHEGAISNEQWLPHFTCHAVGEAIVEIMGSHSDQRLTVLCGHTHGLGECEPLSNVRVLTGGAEYGQPAVQQIFELE